jgi:HD-GYP domain-containing protein (c-di-GMP phosphodiesterase class II)
MSTATMTLIKGESLRLGELPFNVHVKDPRGKLVLYGRKGIVITPEMHDKIVKNNFPMYIEYTDLGTFIDYKLNHIEHKINDPDTPIDKKQGLIKDASVSILQNVRQVGFTNDSARQSNALTKSVVDLIMQSPHSHNGLLSISTISSYLYDHALNTSTFAIMLGYLIYGESKKKLYLLGLGAMLMDIGMAKLNQSVVNKKGDLNPKELEYIRNHTSIGYEMLKDKELPIYVADMALHHHERLDGSGYPDGLNGDRIRPYLRICAAADVYDALTSNRAFRKPMTQLEAISFMLSHKKHFSMDVLHALMKLVLKDDRLINATLQKYQ